MAAVRGRGAERPVLHYVSHPEVVVDPETPIPRWGLSPLGAQRARAMLDQPWVAQVERVVSSDETKAVQAARVLGDHLGLDVEVRPGTGENDRSATGFLPPDEFERVADRFFAEPEVSVRGWERAVDAQARIVHGLADLLRPDGPHDVVVVGHGGVGTLWWCWLADVPISRAHDQPGQGHRFTVDLSSSRPTSGWRSIDEQD